MSPAQFQPYSGYYNQNSPSSDYSDDSAQPSSCSASIFSTPEPVKGPYTAWYPESTRPPMHGSMDMESTIPQGSSLYYSHSRASSQAYGPTIPSFRPVYYITPSYMDTTDVDAVPNEYLGRPMLAQVSICDTAIVGTGTRCQWPNCQVELDDLSHPGIRRHFREYHFKERGTTVRCLWGGSCRSEEMLFENISKHVAECHLKSMARECPTCRNVFARNDTLKRHQNAGCPGATYMRQY